MNQELALRVSAVAHSEEGAIVSTVFRNKPWLVGCPAPVLLSCLVVGICELDLLRKVLRARGGPYILVQVDRFPVGGPSEQLAGPRAVSVLLDCALTDFQSVAQVPFVD